jgi:hypothetical protein
MDTTVEKIQRLESDLQHEQKELREDLTRIKKQITNNNGGRVPTSS